MKKNEMNAADIDNALYIEFCVGCDTDGDGCEDCRIMTAIHGATKFSPLTPSAAEELALATREFLQANALTDDKAIARTYKRLADASKKYDKKEG